MILHLIPEQVDGCAYHRIEVPMHNLRGFDLAQSTIIDGIEDSELHKMQLVVMSRDACMHDVTGQVKRLNKMGLPYVVDIDDYWQMDRYHLLHKDFDKTAARWIALMRGAAAVTTTNQRLADRIKKYNRNVVIVPNALDAKQPQWLPTEKNFKQPVVGWVGGVHHLADIQQLEGTFKRIHKDDIITLALGGYTMNEVYAAFEMWFTDSGKYKKYKRIPAENVYGYGHIYEHIDIALAPLIDTPFNNRKSSLKIIEAGFKGCVCIADRVPPFSDDFTDNEVVFVNNKYEWYDTVTKLHNSEQLLYDYSEKLKESVQRFEIKKVNPIREQLYTTLINGK